MKNKKSKIFNGIFYLTVILIKMIICSYFMFDFLWAIKGMGVPSPERYLLYASAVVIFIIANYLQTVIHEIGHLLGGLLSGYSFIEIGLRNNIWIKRNGKIKRFKYSIPGAAGYCQMMPPEIKDGKTPFILYYLGGIILNLISVPIFILLYNITFESLFASFIFIMCAVCGAGSAIISGVPINQGNDSYSVLMLLKNNKLPRVTRINSMIFLRLINGVRMKDMPEEWFEIPDENSVWDKTVTTVAALYYNRLLDEGRFDEAKRIIDKLLDNRTELLDFQRDAITGDRIYLELIADNNKELIDKLYTAKLRESFRRMKYSLSVVRVKYAYALFYENDTYRAGLARAQFMNRCKTYPYEGEIAGEKELLDIAYDIYSRKLSCND